MFNKHQDKNFVCFICDKGYFLKRWWDFHIDNFHGGYLSKEDFIDKNDQRFEKETYKYLRKRHLKSGIEKASEVNKNFF
jgi:hypothetical protein